MLKALESCDMGLGSSTPYNATIFNDRSHMGIECAQNSLVIIPYTARARHLHSTHEHTLHSVSLSNRRVNVRCKCELLIKNHAKVPDLRAPLKLVIVYFVHLREWGGTKGEGNGRALCGIKVKSPGFCPLTEAIKVGLEDLTI